MEERQLREASDWGAPGQGCHVVLSPDGPRPMPVLELQAEEALALGASLIRAGHLMQDRAGKAPLTPAEMVEEALGGRR